MRWKRRGSNLRVLHVPTWQRAANCHVLVARHQEFLGYCDTPETTGPSKDNHGCSITMLEVGPGHFGRRNKKFWLLQYKNPSYFLALIFV